MNSNTPDKHNEVICSCSGTTEAKIKELIDNGVYNIDRISRITGACTGCGACDSAVMELLTDHDKLSCGSS